MISEQQQELASLHVLGALTAAEKESFEAALRAQPELQAFVRELERTTGLVAQAVPPVALPPELRERVLRAAGAPSPVASPAPFKTDVSNPAFFFRAANDPSGWKNLPVPGASLKLLSADRERGYAVLLGRLERGVRYPAHPHVFPEDILILSGDLTIAGRRMGPGDFHHCDAGTEHPVNFSEEGCTLLAVLSIDHELSRFAMG